MTLVWLGRRQIPGIDPGRTIKVCGRISCQEGRRLLYNPRYELLPSADRPRERPRPRRSLEFRYVEEFVRYQLRNPSAASRDGRGGAAVRRLHRRLGGRPQLYPALGAAVGVAVLLGVIRLVQRQSLKYVATAIIPTAIAAFVATRTGRAEDVFLPGHPLQRRAGGAVVVHRADPRPLVGFVIGAAVGDPTGWAKDRGLVRMTSKLTWCWPSRTSLRFVVQLPLFLAGQVVWLGVAKVVLGWPLLIAALAVIGLLLSKGRTPMEESGLAYRPAAQQADRDSGTPGVIATPAGSGA